ncbi:MAG: HD domain-containing protein [Desulfobacteraceae bacterium]|nr:HD domain-containing protein [Desulfobacteraceae bacterium]
MTIQNNTGQTRQTTAKDLISLLFVGDEKYESQIKLFSRDNGFVSHFCSNEKQGVEKAGTLLPDIILIDKSLTMDEKQLSSLEKLIKGFDEIDFRFKPAFFLGVDKYPEFESRMQLYGYGFDEFIVRPLSAGELYYKSNVYLEKINLEQKQIHQEKILEKSFHYLDKFKQELKIVKKELIQEKTSLNNSLKQIHHMTRERSQMKKSLIFMKECFDQNMVGFEQLLSTLLTTRVEVNRGHALRVAHIACFIAKQFDFDEKKLEDLRKAAMLHELGLLFMPNSALEKGEKEFTNYEKNIWIQYPVKGADLLKGCQGFENSSKVIRSLNEYCDGSGYPDGFKKKYIPLASRILAGADEFDRLKDMPDVHCLEDLLVGLENIAGSRLDPAIVSWLEKYAVLHMGSDAYRVRGIGVEQLEAGMKLGTALFTSSGTKLFSVNTLLTQRSIDKIIRYHREYPVDETVYIKA